MLEGMTTCFA